MGFIKNIKLKIDDMNKPVLSDRTILEYNKKGLLIEGILDKNQIQPNSIDLTLGNTYKVLKPNVELRDPESKLNGLKMIDPKYKIIYDEGIFTNKSYIIMPGKFILMASREILNIPNGILSFVQGRSSIARLGIQTEQAGLIDAGFRGSITFEVFNQSIYPIKVYEGMRIAQVYFFKAQKAAIPYGISKGSKYYGQDVATGSNINKDPELSKFYRSSKIPTASSNNYLNNYVNRFH